MTKYLGYYYGRYDKAEFTYLNVTRAPDDILYMTYYFPQWHLIPENRLQTSRVSEGVRKIMGGDRDVPGSEGEVYYNDWDFVRT